MGGRISQTAAVLKYGDIKDWDTSRVTNMHRMFYVNALSKCSQKVGFLKNLYFLF
jgi:hypothetical protein